MRRLNMKGYRARGGGGTATSKGSKFKRKQWKKKSFQFGAKSNFGSENKDDDNFNYNLVGNDLPTVAAENEGKLQYICFCYEIIS